MISAVAASSLFAASAQAATLCSINDISPTAQACAGFYDGNLLSGSPADILAQKNALALLGFTWDGLNVEKIDTLNGSHIVDFDTLLKGVSYVGFHFGNGQGGPGNATAFYRLDAGAGLDQINLAYNASSNAVLYFTNGGGIPEPATWAMMITGFGLAGVALRRRRAADVVA
ncbi:MAG TPA: PEPxxWA-CTERM sorting domain-containing protein [Phenylobacterium sp.]|nr:PEPxxWA-CTERM sorting domain-containing protein [Phenylobacterium sp.]